jgi:hypothetical protein
MLSSFRLHKQSYRQMHLTEEHAVQLRRIDAEVLDQHVGKDIAELDRGPDISSRIEIRVDQRRRKSRHTMIEPPLTPPPSTNQTEAFP